MLVAGRNRAELPASASWRNTSRYEVSDIVQQGGSAWVAVEPNVNGPPARESANWALNTGATKVSTETLAREGKGASRGSLGNLGQLVASAHRSPRGKEGLRGQTRMQVPSPSMGVN